ncbi:MAG TPA: nicotinate phosphoribosyltransferase [Ferroplasma sp.]|jgi:nicotinate phosphoribosyltransferase|nr:nicotinate phosphoribosyltransferase [Ferroplasma sp.]
MNKFIMANDSDIMSGIVTDVYFEKTIKYLKQLSKNPYVTMEVTTQSSAYDYINFTGLNDVITLLESHNVNVQAIPEGTVIRPRDRYGVPVPFLRISGKYLDFAELETPLLGFLCQASGISSYSSLIKKTLGDIPFISFGIRRMHPAISAMIERSSYIGGASGVSGIFSSRTLGIEPSGTMPHALSLILGDHEAWKAQYENSNFRVFLIDTYMDEKFAALKAAEEFPDIDFIRLDTPSSRRGNFPNLIREIRWELDIRGHKNIKIMVSGGIKLEDIPELIDAGVKSFGIGTSISSAKPVDFGMDIVNIDGNDITKRGKFSGIKNVYRCRECNEVIVSYLNEVPVCSCGGRMENLLIPYLDDGKTKRVEDIKTIRKRSLEEINKIMKL